MAKLTYLDRTLPIDPDESVLDCLERHGISRPSSCRSGVCQSCLMKAPSGTPPSKAQTGLKDTWKAQNYFLACVCVPDGDMHVADCDELTTFDATVTAVEPLAANVIRVTVQPNGELAHHPGQFVSVVRPADGLTRPYSIASGPNASALELHVAVLDNGQMSGWLQSAKGQTLKLRGPSGECFYQDGKPDQPLLLAGTGTGLAPLLGVLRSALQAGHQGPIHLFHGSPTARGLYLWDELTSLASRHGNLTVIGSVLNNERGLAEVSTEPIDAMIPRHLPNLAGYRVYLCGNPELVAVLKKQAFLAGAALQEIHSDPFVIAKGP